MFKNDEPNSWKTLVNFSCFDLVMLEEMIAVGITEIRKKEMVYTTKVFLDFSLE